MNFLAKLFRNSKNTALGSDSTKEFHPLSNNELNDSANADDVSANPQTNDPTDLPSGIKQIVSARGNDILTQNMFINILDDYHLFSGQRYVKNALRQLQQGDYIDCIINSSNWDLDSKSLVIKMIADFGVQERIAKFLILSLGYGIGLTDEKPVLSEESEISNVKAHEHIKVEVQDPLSNNGSCTKYDPKSELLRYKSPLGCIARLCPDSTYFQILSKADFSQYNLPLVLEDCIDKESPKILDLSECPHIMIAGSTMSGKSTLIHSMISSLLLAKHPSELKLILMDGNGLEFNNYDRIERQFLAKKAEIEDQVISQPNDAIATINSLCEEIDTRWSLFKMAKVRNIQSYNEKFCQHMLKPEKSYFYLPYIVLIIDEYNPFLLHDKKAIETCIAKIGQKGPISGIHMILSTNQVTREVVTPIIRQQFPIRIAFRTLSAAASRLIINNGEAIKLSSKGTYLLGGTDGVSTEMTNPIIKDEYIEELTAWIDNQIGYPQAYCLHESDKLTKADSLFFNDKDPLFEQVARYVVYSNVGSTSAIQRYYNIGYNRAGALMNKMEMAGIVGPANGAKPRKILVDSMRLNSILAGLR